MNILIIEPPAVSPFGNQRIFGGNGSSKSDFRKPPLDLMMISGYLRKEGFDNTLLDANASRMTLDQVKQIIRETSPEVVLYSTSTCTIHKDLLISVIAKEVNPAIVTVAIGTHVMAIPEEVFGASEALDAAVISSEWEQAALNIVRNISDLKTAKGIMFRDTDGQIIKTDEQSPMEDLDDLGFPAHDKLDNTLYGDPTSKRFPKTMVMGQKACINNCSFCCQPAFFGAPHVRRRSVGHFLKELKWVQELGYQEVMFNDATLTSDKEWARELFEGMLADNIDLAWNCSTRADCVDSEILALMKKTGCHTIAMGMESVDPIVLKNIRKNVNPEQIREVVAMIKKHGMNTVLFCVIGFPGETEASINTTINFLTKLDTTFITLGIAVPVPGTDFYRYVEENGYLLTKDWSRYDPMQPPVFSYPELSAEKIAYYSAHGLRKFYLRPSYILDRLKSIRSISDLAGYFNNFIGFMKRYVLPKNNQPS